MDPPGSPASAPPASGHRAVLWALWAGIVIGVLFFRFGPLEIAASARSGNTGVAALWPVFLALPAFLSLGARLLLLPRSRVFGKVVVALVLALSFAEALTLFGRFLFPARLDLFFATSAALLLLHCPAFVRVDPPARHDPAAGEPQLRGVD